MNQRTSLYEQHLAAGAKMVDFAGWDMPINYGSQVAEHKQVREHAGVFDVSHMTVVDVTGNNTRDFLRYLLTNDAIKLSEPGRALYSIMLNEEGGIVDDLIVYRMSDRYRLVVNCATREKDLAWLEMHSKNFAVSLAEQSDVAILAVHGPESIGIVCSLLPPAEATMVAELGNFRCCELDGRFVARTGYTGEKGLELIMPEADAAAFWDKLLAAGVKPVGLGARDTLRLEAGMNLYGHDMDETTSPLAANLEQVINWEPEDREFIGRTALKEHKALQAAGHMPVLTGLVLEGRGVLREGQKVVCADGEGTVTSGGFSPTLNMSIALARIPPDTENCQVQIRRDLVDARVVKPGFVRLGKKIFT